MIFSFFTFLSKRGSTIWRYVRNRETAPDARTLTKMALRRLMLATMLVWESLWSSQKTPPDNVASGFVFANKTRMVRNRTLEKYTLTLLIKKVFTLALLLIAFFRVGEVFRNPQQESIISSTRCSGKSTRSPVRSGVF